MVTLHCPRCRTAAPSGVTDPIIECATCAMSFTADDGARAAPPGEITRMRSPEGELAATIAGDTITITVPASRHQRILAPVVAIGLTALAIALVASLSAIQPIPLLVFLVGCALSWYAAIGAMKNLTTIEIAADQVTASVHPAPVTRRQSASRAAARHARARSYEVRGTTFHCVLVDEGGRAIPLAYTATEGDAKAAAALIRTHAA